MKGAAITKKRYTTVAATDIAPIVAITRKKNG
jgi:hypothetical protein